jgi:hypothetical protein
LLLCKPVRDSERKYTPITGKNQGKERKQGNILEYRMEELGPMGSPLVGPLTVFLLLLLLGPCLKTTSPGSFTTGWMLVRLQLVRQYQTACRYLPKMVIRDYKE